MSSQNRTSPMTRAELVTMVYKITDAASRALDQLISSEPNWEYVVAQLHRALQASGAAHEEAQVDYWESMEDNSEPAGELDQAAKDVHIAAAVEALLDTTPVTPAECTHEWTDARIMGGQVSYRCAKCGVIKLPHE